MAEQEARGRLQSQLDALRASFTSEHEQFESEMGALQEALASERQARMKPEQEVQKLQSLLTTAQTRLYTAEGRTLELSTATEAELSRRAALEKELKAFKRKDGKRKGNRRATEDRWLDEAETMLQKGEAEVAARVTIV